MKKAALIACAAMVVSAATTGAAVADTPTMCVGAYGGSTENRMKEKIIPLFEAQNDVRIVYVPGNSTDTFAKPQARTARRNWTWCSSTTARYTGQWRWASARRSQTR